MPKPVCCCRWPHGTSAGKEIDDEEKSDKPWMQQIQQIPEVNLVMQQLQQMQQQ